MSLFFRLAVVAGATVLIGLAGAVFWNWFHLPASHGLPPASPHPLIPSAERLDTPFMVPGIRQPAVVSAEAAALDDDAIVIGTQVGNRCRAYALAPLSSMAGHVVNDLIEGAPVTVTYCDETDCARVFSDPGGTTPLAMGTGGRVKGELNVTVDGKFYPQRSKQIPFNDHPFERVTWKAWREAHPDTDVYVGGP